LWNDWQLEFQLGPYDPANPMPPAGGSGGGSATTDAGAVSDAGDAGGMGFEADAGIKRHPKPKPPAADAKTDGGCAVARPVGSAPGVVTTIIIATLAMRPLRRRARRVG
jgi:hypothetical protein